jgi:hypothetical protein
MKIIILLILLSQNSFSQVIQNFKTDGCTMYRNGTRDEPQKWLHCCLEHDLRYWIGGDYDDQKISDLKLKQCVKKAAGNLQSQLIYRGVRLGHYSPIKTKYSWGWGWIEDKKFTSLSVLEKEIALSSIESSEIDPNVKAKFIGENLSFFY